MFLYKIGYNSPEDSEYSEMEHKKKYSKEELNEIVINAVVRVLDKIACGDYPVYIFGEGPSYDDIHKYVIEELKQDGFKKVKYQSIWSCFGWASLIDKESWRRDRGDNLNQIFEAIPKETIEDLKKMARRNDEEDERELNEWSTKNQQIFEKIEIEKKLGE